MANKTDEPVPEWIKELSIDIFENICDDASVSEVAEIIKRTIAKNPPLLFEVPWKVISQVDMPYEKSENERVIGFRCKMPEDAPFMTYEKMEWLRSMLHGRDAIRK